MPSNVSPEGIQDGLRRARLAAQVAPTRNQVESTQRGSVFQIAWSTANGSIYTPYLASGPTLIRLDSVSGATVGTTANQDFGTARVWARLGDATAGERAAIMPIGNYLYLPRAGRYFLFFILVGVPGIVPRGCNCSLFTDVDSSTVHSLMSGTFPSAKEQSDITLAPATGASLVTANMIYGVGSSVNGGRQLALDSVTLINKGANPTQVMVGYSPTLAPTAGFTLAPAGVLTLPREIVLLSCVQGYSTLGTTVESHATYRY